MKSVELAIKAGRARQSPQTGFVHHSYENPERGAETIPVYENFCFALALFRTKIVENVLEAKALLERLFAFQTPEGFPIYLHEFPQCKSRKLEQKLSVVAQFLIRDFSTVLGEGLRSKLESLIRSVEPTEEWADFLIQSQLTGEDPSPATKWWDGKALCFAGPQKQERGEPAVTLFDLIMGEWTGALSARALIDHPIHIQASLIYTASSPKLDVWASAKAPAVASINKGSILENMDPLSIVQPRGFGTAQTSNFGLEAVYPKTATATKPVQNWSPRFWGNGSPTHSALLHTQGSVTSEGDTIVIDLPEKEVHDEVEISYFINRYPGAQFTVSGSKSTTFQLGESVVVESGGESFEITFSLLEGDGRFWGHLHLANRPGQIGCKGPLKHEAFDRSIALRTIERAKAARIKIAFRLISN